MKKIFFYQEGGLTREPYYRELWEAANANWNSGSILQKNKDGETIFEAGLRNDWAKIPAKYQKAWLGLWGAIDKNRIFGDGFDSNYLKNVKNMIEYMRTGANPDKMENGKRTFPQNSKLFDNFLKIINQNSNNKELINEYLSKNYSKMGALDQVGLVSNVLQKYGGMDKWGARKAILGALKWGGYSFENGGQLNNRFI